MNSTEQLTWYIKNSIPCMFVKYGDGEFNAANLYEGVNCDGTPYTKLLGAKIRESFIYNSAQKNAMIGCWHDLSNVSFWKDLSSSVAWADYHTILIDGKESTTYAKYKLELYKSIKESTRKKIYVSNSAMYRVCDMLSVDAFIDIDPVNWFETEYDSVVESVKAEMNGCDCIVILSAGMGAKPLISDLHKAFPSGIYIDAGSAFDMICRRKATRCYSPPYAELREFLTPILPDSWV